MTQFIHSANIQLGYTRYNRLERQEGYPDAVTQVIDAVIENDVVGVIHAGDLFNTSRPGTTAIREYCRLHPIWQIFITRLYDNGDITREIMFRRLLRVLGNKANDSPKNDSTTASPVGSFDHYTDAVDTIKQLKRERRHNEAESLLLWCIEQTEREEFGDPAPWYYKHLAIVYRKENRYNDEVQLIERYLNNASSPREDLQKRLHRVKELAENDESG